MELAYVNPSCAGDVSHARYFFKKANLPVTEKPTVADLFSNWILIYLYQRR